MIRDRISQILDLPIREGRWMTYTEGLDREGKLDRKIMMTITMAACEELEKLENRVKELETLLATPEKPKEAPNAKPTPRP